MGTYESFGKYVLLEKLATGGMAEVFLARGTGAGGIGKFFAVKRILPQYADSPEFIEMFKDEAKIAINLNHSNIVSIHEFGVEKGQFFIVMDYVEGRNLRQILNKMKKSNLQFSIDQIVYVVKEVCAGLDHAHRCIDGTTGKPLNITHRDMSPQNVMVSFEGEVKIVDFGIAKAESQIETTRAGTLKGKFGYMSPEQAEGQAVDLRTDIFSLGIVLWELLANDRLFVANNEINTLRKIRDCQIPSLRKINPNIHTELERIVQKALARDRNLRYQTGAALHRDLNRFLNRQYPDFSPQDFAVFIKSVFADEILSLRKRLVEYSKVNLTISLNIPAADKSFDERTSLLNTNTNTNSLVVSTSSTAQTNEPASTSREIHTLRKKEATAPRIEKDSKTEPEATNSNLVTANSVPSLRIAETGTHSLPPTARPQSAPSRSVLDDKALAAESHRPPPVAVRTKQPLSTNTLETEEVSSPSISRDTRSQYYSRSRKRAPPKRKTKNAPMRMATFMVFALLCLSIYSYLVKYFTPMMTDVITMTDPVLHELHCALGVCGTSISSEAPPKPVVRPPQPRPQEPAQEDPMDTSVVVISNPSGAEILIDDKSTGLVTPSRVEVPRGAFSITIRKHGYVDSKMRDTTRDKIGHRLIANLVKMNVAYLDIDVFPPQDAILSINGKRLNTRYGPIRELPVQANTPLRIRAETRNGSSYDEVTVNLPVDRRQSVQLNPRRPLRVPSSPANE